MLDIHISWHPNVTWPAETIFFLLNIVCWQARELTTGEFQWIGNHTCFCSRSTFISDDLIFGWTVTHCCLCCHQVLCCREVCAQWFQPPIWGSSVEQTFILDIWWLADICSPADCCFDCLLLVQTTQADPGNDLFSRLLAGGDFISSTKFYLRAAAGELQAKAAVMQSSEEREGWVSTLQVTGINWAATNILKLNSFVNSFNIEQSRCECKNKTLFSFWYKKTGILFITFHTNVDLSTCWKPHFVICSSAIVCFCHETGDRKELAAQVAAANGRLAATTYLPHPACWHRCTLGTCTQ